MKRRSTRLALTLPVVAAMFVAGCSPGGETAAPEEDPAAPETDTAAPEETESSAAGGDVIIAYGAAVQSFDPLASVSGGDYSYYYPVYDTLIEMDDDSNAAPGLAESWEIEDDLTITLSLREGIEFHDGAPFDAESVKWNLDRANSETSNTRDLASIESVEVVDESTVQLNLNQPDASILLVLSDRPGTMISPTAFEEYGDDYHLNPVGTGAFSVTEHISNQSVRYEKNDAYWKEGVPELDSLTFSVMGDENSVVNALRSGQVQVAGLGPSGLAAVADDPAFTIEVSEQMVYNQLLLNMAEHPMDNPQVREAISLAIDKEGINQALTAGAGTVGSQTFPEGYPAYNPDVTTEYDPERARQLLAESGVAAEDLSINILYFSGLGYWPALAEAVAAQLGEVGFTVDLEPMEVTAALAAWAQGEASAALFTWSGRNDPLQTLYALYSADGASNQGKTSPEGMEDLLAAARSTYEPADRVEIFHDIVALADEYDYHVVINYLPRVEVFSSELGGFTSHFVKKPDYSTLSYIQ